MKTKIAVSLLVSALAIDPNVSLGQSREMESALREMGILAMSPLQDEEKIKAFSEIVSSMNKTKLDAFTEVLSICSSSQDCSPQVESYGLKFQEKSEDPIINALKVVNNQYKPSRGSRPDRGTADDVMYIFKLRIQPVIRKRYSEF